MRTQEISPPPSDLVREMRRRWRSGECPPAEEFLARQPDLSDHPECAVDLIYEEYCQRQAAGQDGVEQNILQRFPKWAGPLRVMLDCHQRLLKLDDDRPQFPACGERLGEFRLVSELGRGARGRVFLATQSALADRPVVLKIAPLDGAEHLSLARLQHTNIVPLYSVLDDPARRIHILCMPYFGKATLASLLTSLIDIPFSQRTGRHIVDAIDRMQDSSMPAIASAARQMLASISYPQAMCWIATCLADALQFAHERGIVHLDLKPSNILLASDGQPMLLDFHLAREPFLPGAAVPENFGGTRPYMPPEQETAMRSLLDGKKIDIAVDGRADIYALGAILHEALGGKFNPQVSVGLSDIIAKCLATQPHNRYATAGALVDDLRRHLTDQPLAGVSNRNLSERWSKWRRRRPSRLRTIAMIFLIVASAAILLAGKWSQLRERHQQAQLALRDGQRQLSNHQIAEAVATFERGLALASDPPLQRELRDQLSSAKRLALAQQIHQLAEEIRLLYGSDSIPLAPLAAQCDTFWEKREQIRQTVGDMGSFDFAPDFMDIAIFAASVRPSDAAKILQEADQMFGPNPVLQYERSAHMTSTAKTSWDHYALGRAMLRRGDLQHASAELTKALELDPAARWPNFYFGLCAYRLAHYDEAINSFSVCIGNAPTIAGYFYNRALAHAALGHFKQAIADCDRALQLDPSPDLFAARKLRDDLRQKTTASN